MGLIERTIDELFEEAVQNFGDRTAVVYREDRYTWRELSILVDMIADRLEAQGVARGEHVGLWSENSAAWIVTFLALQKLGAVPALLNFNYRERELIQVMRIGDIRWLCYGNTHALSEQPGMIAGVASRVGLRGTVDIREETLGLRKLLDSTTAHVSRAVSGADPHGLACMLYTSGTTMEPKCVLHDHYSLVNNAIVTAERAQMSMEDRICLSQPLFHIYALNASLLSAIHCGAMLCVLSRFGSEDILRCVQDERCTILNGVPTNFLRLISSPVFHKYRTDSLRLSAIGGASIHEAQIDRLRQALPGLHVVRNYGLTEGCNLCNSELSDDPESIARTVGHPYPYIEIAIQDPKDRRLLPVGETGEILVRGYSVMLGYYHAQPEKLPPSAIDEDGWLHTGDLGVMDEQGRVAIVGRIKDIIIRGGENITPAEICKEIMRYEPVLDVLVVGAPHPILGEEVIACVVLETPEDYSEDELRSLLKVRLARYKIPAFFLIYDQFPLRPNGKVDMRALREDVAVKARELHKGDERYDVTLRTRT